MEYQTRFQEWLTCDEVSQDDKARLSALTEDEKKEAFLDRKSVV